MLMEAQVKVPIKLRRMEINRSNKKNVGFFFFFQNTSALNYTLDRIFHLACPNVNGEYFYVNILISHLCKTEDGFIFQLFELPVMVQIDQVLDFSLRVIITHHHFTYRVAEGPDLAHEFKCVTEYQVENLIVLTFFLQSGTLNQYLSFYMVLFLY